MITSRKHTVFEYIEYNCKKLPKTNCWEWTSSKDKDGYGRACFNSKRERAHRLSYRVYKGNIEKEDLVCHTCDNPSCINPDHLFKGNTKINVQDKLIKGRQLRGEQITNSKLTSEQVIKIRELRKTLTLKQLSQLYKVTMSNISDICNKNTWKHI